MMNDPKTRAQFDLWAEQIAGLAEQNGRLLKQLAEARNTINRQKRELHAMDARRDAAMRLASGLAEAVDVGIDASTIEIHGD